jgi:hypothetical protein
MGFNLGNVVKDVAHAVTHVVNPMGRWLANAARTAGRPIGSAVKFVSKEMGKVDHFISKIPIVGPLFHAVWDIEYQFPFTIAAAIVSGQRIDKVAMNALHDACGDVKALGPYVETVIAIVPGVGPEASAAIATGVALASGERIDQALLDGAAALVPGGAIAKAAIQVGIAAMQGKVRDFTQLGGALVSGVAGAVGVTIPDAAKDAIMGGLKIASDLAQGQKIDKAVIDGAVAAIPDSAGAALKLAASAAGAAVVDVSDHKAVAAVADTLIAAGQAAMPGLTPDQRQAFKGALTIGAGLGHGQFLQGCVDKAVKSPNTQNALRMTARVKVVTDPLLQNARKIVTATGSVGGDTRGRGFDIGVGLMHHGCTRYEVMAMREQMKGPDKKGFDIACSTHIGRVTTSELPGNAAHPGARAAYYATIGMQGMPGQNNVAMMKVIAANPNGRMGAVVAIKQVAQARTPKWWEIWKQ